VSGNNKETHTARKHGRLLLKYGRGVRQVVACLPGRGADEWAEWGRRQVRAGDMAYGQVGHRGEQVTRVYATASAAELRKCAAMRLRRDVVRTCFVARNMTRGNQLNWLDKRMDSSALGQGGGTCPPPRFTCCPPPDSKAS